MQFGEQFADLLHVLLVDFRVSFEEFAQALAQILQMNFQRRLLLSEGFDRRRSKTNEF